MMQKENIQRMLWYVFVFLLPWQTIWIFREVFVGGEKWQYGTISLYASEIVLLVWLLWLFLDEKTVFVENVRKIFCGERGSAISFVFGTVFLIWIFVTVFWASDSLLTLSYVGVFFLGAGIIWGIQRKKIDIRKTVIVLLLSITFQAVVGIGQFIMQESPRISVLGMSEYRPNMAGVSVLKGEERVLRSYGGMSHPNVLGGVLAVGILLALWIWITARSRVESIGSLIFVFISLLALFLTFSRSSWGGFLMGFFFLFIWMFIRKKDWRRRTVPIFVLVLFAIGVYGFLLRDLVSPRFETERILLEGSVRDRSQLAHDTFAIWKIHPIVGIGLENSTRSMMEQSFGQEALQKEIPVWEYQPAHNVFLLALAELGIIGSAFLFFFLYNVGIQGRHIFREGRIQDGTLLATLVTLIPIAFLDHWLWTSHFGILFTGLLIGMFSLGTRTHACVEKCRL